MNIQTLTQGADVRLHIGDREVPARYLFHTSADAVVSVTVQGTESTFKVPWASTVTWISDPTTRQAFVLSESGDAIAGAPPERE